MSTRISEAIPDMTPLDIPPAALMRELFPGRCVEASIVHLLCLHGSHQDSMITHSEECLKHQATWNGFLCSTSKSHIEEFIICRNDRCPDRCEPVFERDSVRYQEMVKNIKIQVLSFEAKHPEIISSRKDAEELVRQDNMRQYHQDVTELRAKFGEKLHVLDLTIPKEKMLQTLVETVDDCEDRQCSACYEPLTEGQLDENGDSATIPNQGLPRRLPCGHEFHLTCLVNWFIGSSRCSVCRADDWEIVLFNGFDKPVRRRSPVSVDYDIHGSELQVGGYISLTAFRRADNYYRQRLRLNQFRPNNDRFGVSNNLEQLSSEELERFALPNAETRRVLAQTRNALREDLLSREDGFREDRRELMGERADVFMQHLAGGDTSGENGLGEDRREIMGVHIQQLVEGDTSGEEPDVPRGRLSAYGEGNLAPMTRDFTTIFLNEDDEDDEVSTIDEYQEDDDLDRIRTEILRMLSITQRTVNDIMEMLQNANGTLTLALRQQAFDEKQVAMTFLSAATDLVTTNYLTGEFNREFNFVAGLVNSLTLVLSTSPPVLLPILPE